MIFFKANKQKLSLWPELAGHRSPPSLGLSRRPQNRPDSNQDILERVELAGPRRVVRANIENFGRKA